MKQGVQIMGQACHIFSKDVRYLWREIVLVLVLAAMFAWVGTRAVDSPFGMLLIPACCWLIARLIQAETLPGDRQYWVTRPYSWKALLGAKLLFIAAFVNLPILLAQLAIVIAGDFPLWSSLPGLLWTQVLFWFCMALPIAALSSVIAGIVPLILTIFVVLVVAVGTIFALPFGFDMGTVLGPLEWVKNAVFVIAAAAIVTLVLRAQYKARETLFSRIFLAAGAAVAVLAYMYLPLPAAFAMQSGISHPNESRQRFDGSSLRVAIVENKLFRQREFRNEPRDLLRILVPISVDGVPFGTDVLTDAIRIELQWPDGRVWRSSAREMVGLQKRAVEGNVYDGVMSISRALSDAERDQPVTLRGSVYLTLFGSARSRTIPVRKKPVNVMDGLQCFKVTLPGTQFLCRAIFRWPLGIVAAGFSQNDVRPLVGAISYSPFPAGLSLNPIEAHSPEGAPTLEKQVDIVIKEPLVHIRHDFELRGVHIVDVVVNPDLR
jgi:hypothetical protein